MGVCLYRIVNARSLETRIQVEGNGSVDSWGTLELVYGKVQDRAIRALWTKLSFCFGGLITLFQLFHTPCKVRKLPSHQRNSKKGFVCTHFSLHDPLSLSLSPVKVKEFQLSFFYNIIALSYLPRARTSAPRRFQGTLLYCFTLQCSRSSRFVRPTQSSGVTSHYSVDSRARCPCPTLQTPYIYTSSNYRDRFPTVTSSAYGQNTWIYKHR